MILCMQEFSDICKNVILMLEQINVYTSAGVGSKTSLMLSLLANFSSSLFHRPAFIYYIFRIMVRGQLASALGRQRDAVH